MKSIFVDLSLLICALLLFDLSAAFVKRNLSSRNEEIVSESHENSQNDAQATKKATKSAKNENKVSQNVNKPIYNITQEVINLQQLLKKRNVSVTSLMTSSSFSLLSISCEVCLVFAEHLSELLDENFTEDAIAEIAVEFCKVADMYPPHICTLAIREWNETFFWILDNSVFEPKEMCGLISTSCGDPVYPPSAWNLSFPSTVKPPYKPMKKPPTGLPTLKVLFVTDFHVDPEYTTGAKVDCGDPLCCRTADHKSAKKGGKIAPKWGALGKCDVPPRTLETLFDQVKGEKFDLVLFTGDISPHDVYNQTIESQKYLYNLTYSMFMRHFPNTPVLSAIGNHESNPVDQFIPPFFGPGESKHPMEWLYNQMAHNSRRWLPKETEETIKRGGFWSWEVVPGLKVVAINTNYGVHANWYMRITNRDVVDQVQWLIGELQHAEDQGLRVWIIAHHVVPDDQDFQKWYYKVLQRYSGSIASIFYGHSHLDDFQVYLDSTQNDMPVLAGKVGPGVTGYHGDYAMNFGFHVVTTDGKRENSTFGVLDIETRFLNLTETQQTGTPIWRKEYSMREEYQLKSLFPEDYLGLVDRMRQDSNITKLYYYRKYKSSRPLDACDEECVESTINSLIVHL